MTENEELREALLELKVLRDREARRLQETGALLSAIEAYSGAHDPEAALCALFDAMERHTGAVAVALLTVQQEVFSVAAASDPAMLECTLEAPVDLTRRDRNLTDLALAGQWSGTLDMQGFAAMLTAAHSREGPVLVAWLPPGQSFARLHLDFASRLVGLAARALQNRAIAAENTLLAATIEGSSAGFAISDATSPERPLIYVNDAFEQISGFSRNEVLGQNCRFLSAEAPATAERARLRETVAKNGAGRFLLRNRHKDGALFWNELTLFPVQGADGQPRYLVASQNDVSDRVAAAEERDAARKMLENSLAATTQAFLILDAAGVVQFANPATLELFPAPRTRWAAGVQFSEHWQDYCKSAELMSGRLTRLVREGDLLGLSRLPKGMELDLPDGRSVLAKASRVEGGLMVVTAADVTPMKVAQRLLAQRLAAIEAAEDGIALVDAGGRLTFANSSAARLLGFPEAGRALGRRWHRFYRHDVPPDLARPFERRLSRDGKTATVQSHDITGTPLDNGGAVIVIRDATERVAAEKRAADLTQALARAQRQQAVAELTAGVAHDFNNLLSAVTGSAALIGLEAEDPAAVRGHADRIGVAGRRAARLINRLLDMGDASARKGRFGLATVMDELPALVGPSMSTGISLKVVSPEVSLLLQGDSTELSQILVNMLLNARDAMQGRTGVISVRADRRIAAQSQSLNTGRLQKGRVYACIEVSDQGHGMSEQTRDEIFQPYFSTKGARGTGLGLAVVAMQLEAMGGGVAVDSTPGEGTVLRIYWPLADALRSTQDTQGDPLDPASDHQDGLAAQSAGPDLTGMTVLLVDDERAVSEVAQAYLEGLGAEVAACDDPRDALEILREEPRSWSVLVTDYDMPYLTGGDLVDAREAHAPDLPVILITAMARRLNDARVNEGRVTAVLPKPLDLDGLAHAVAACRKDKES